MQDRAIAAIGEWQLEQKKDSEPVDLYIENMFPGKDWQILLLVFEISGNGENLSCKYHGVDIEKISADNDKYKKYAYRKGSARGGDITLTTKLGMPVEKKLNTIKTTTFKKILDTAESYYPEKTYFSILYKTFQQEYKRILNELNERFSNFSREQLVNTGLSFKLVINGEESYLRNFKTIKKILIDSGSEGNYIHAGTVSKAKEKISSVSGKKAEEIYGFAAPFKFSSPDKPGFISGFFNKKKNWRNYPVSSKEALILELGRKYVQQNLTGYFYGHEYMMVPHPVIKTDKKSLERVIALLKTAFDDDKKARKEKKKRAEDRILKLIAKEKNYFNLDLLFYKEDKTTKAITIEMMIEEVLPSRFRKLFIDVPEKVNGYKIFKNAIKIKNEQQDLFFTFEIIKEFFNNDFLDITNKLFNGIPITRATVFEYIMQKIRRNYNDSKTKEGFVNPLYWSVLKSIMLLFYLNELNIISTQKNYRYMETDNTEKMETTFNVEKFNEFISENKAFLDSDLKVGIFALGILVRFLFDIQNANLHNTPFESKLRGYKLNPELLMTVYTEALDKIQKYQNFYTYQDLRDIISKYFVVKSDELKSLSNNELSFYFVAGLELGKEFKRNKENNVQ